MSDAMDATVPTPVPDAGDAGARIRQARELESAGQLDAAAEAYQQALALENDNVEALQGLSEIHVLRGDSTAAADVQKRLTTLGAATLFDERVQTGRALWTRGDYDQALFSFNRASMVARNDAERSRAFELMGDVMVIQNDPEAAEVLRQAFTIDPSNIEARAAAWLYENNALPADRAAYLRQLKRFARALVGIIGSAPAAPPAPPAPTYTPPPAAVPPPPAAYVPPPPPPPPAAAPPPPPPPPIPRAPIPAPVPLSPGEIGIGAVENLLSQTGLKYQKNEDTVILPFDVENLGIDTLRVQIKSVDDLVVVAVPLLRRDIDETRLMYHLCRACNDLDFFKIVIQPSGEIYASAEVYIDLLNPKILEMLIRIGVALVDTPNTTFGELQRLIEHIRTVQGYYRATYLDPANISDQLLPQFAAQMNIPCEAIEERRFRLEYENVKIFALCAGAAVYARATFNDLNPGKTNLAYFRQMLQSNMQIDVCKLLLDSDDDFSIAWEVPQINQRAFSKLMPDMMSYLVQHGRKLADLKNAGG